MKKVLLADDKLNFQALIKHHLESMGLAVIATNNAMEVVEKAIEEMPQLILMDMIMEGMDGRELTRMLRENPETKDIPIIAMAAPYSKPDLASCLEAGCNDSIIKPFSPTDLQIKLQKLLPN